MVGSNPKAGSAPRALPRPGLRIHVHDDARVLDGMFALVELAKDTQLLSNTLCAMCRLVSELCHADVVSVYLREQRPGGDALVMHGNVGFPPDVIGRVELGLYDGLTGVVAERRRPVTVAVAQAEDRYKHVDGIGEEHFPAYLGVPLLHRDDVVGVLVLQRRRSSRFTPTDVTLASSLTAPFIFAIERDGVRRYPARSSFSGLAAAPGRSVGTAVVMPSPSEAASFSETAAMRTLELDLVTATQRLGHARGPQVARALANFGLLAIALRERARDDTPRDDAIEAMERAPYRASSGDKGLGVLLDERRTELVDLWAFLAADSQQRLALLGGVLVARRLGAFLALEAVARGAAAVVVGEPIGPDASEVLKAAGIPTISDVPELVACVQGGEILDVDAGRASVRIVERQS
jgi:phosphotransferase system, enzyme I, PtsP